MFKDLVAEARRVGATREDNNKTTTALMTRLPLSLQLLLLPATHGLWATQQRLSRSSPSIADPAPLGYDWSKSTAENHQIDSAPFRSEFAASRERLCAR